jgi:hypothetical protein
VDNSSSRGLRPALSAIAVIANLLFTGCCKDEIPQVYRSAFDFDIPIELVQVESSAGTETLDLDPLRAAGTPFRGYPVRGRVSGEEWGFNLGLVRTTEDPVRVLWTQAVYADEHGRTHSLIPWSGGGLPRPGDPVTDEDLPAATESLNAVGVSEKVTKKRVSCTSWTAHHEPVVPWAQELDPYRTREKVLGLAKNGYRLEYRIPIQHGGETKLLRLVFGLKKRGVEGDWSPMGLY